MHGTLKFSVVIILITTILQGIKAESDEVQEVINQQFIVDEHKDTRGLVKAELHKLFVDLSETINQRLQKMESKMELSLSKLTESFHEKQTTMHSNLSASWNQKEIVRDSKIEKLIENLSASFMDKLSTTETNIENSLSKISGLFLQKLTTFDSNITSTVANVSSSLVGSLPKLVTIEMNQQQLSQSFANLTETIRLGDSRRESLLPFAGNNQIGIAPSCLPPTSQTVVEEIEGELGTIEFDGREKSNVRRKLWIFRAIGKQYLNANFVLEENALGSEAHLLLWDVGNSQHEYTGSQTDWMTPRTFGGVGLLVVMLTNANSNVQPPSFKLKFNITRSAGDYLRASELMTKEGLQSVSYPLHNSENYQSESRFHGVMAPSKGKPFAFSLKYLDIPGTPPNCTNGYLRLWFLVESPTGTKFVEQSKSSYSGCGRLGNITELIGHTTVAVLRFDSRGETGRGFRLEIENSG